MPEVPPLPHLRFRWAEKSDDALPELTRIVLAYYRTECIGRPSLELSVPVLPPSVNSLYIKDALRGKNRSFNLDPLAKAFRDTVAFALNGRPSFRPTGVTGGVVVFQSPTWVTAQKMPRRKDMDNKLKTLFDSIGMATSVDDCLHWGLTVNKLYGHEERTRVWLFDCGDVIDASSERTL